MGHSVHAKTRLPSCPQALKKTCTPWTNLCSLWYWAWLNARCLSPGVLWSVGPLQCFPVDLNSSWLFWNLAESAPHSLAVWIMHLATSRSPWWFWPTSATMKYGCCLPTQRPGHSSSSRGIAATHAPSASLPTWAWLPPLPVSASLLNVYQESQG